MPELLSNMNIAAVGVFGTLRWLWLRLVIHPETMPALEAKCVFGERA
jgi:hypothetical protein